MTLIVKLGRRVPRSYATRGFRLLASDLALQETMWIMLKQSFSMARSKWRQNSFNGVGKIYDFTILNDSELEDISNKIIWMNITVQGDKDAEIAEHEAILKMYSTLGNMMQKEVKVNQNMKKVFKTHLLTEQQIMKAYNSGLENAGAQKVVDKLLELGIMTYIELKEDWHRVVEVNDITEVNEVDEKSNNCLVEDLTHPLS